MYTEAERYMALTIIFEMYAKLKEKDNITKETIEKIKTKVEELKNEINSILNNYNNGSIPVLMKKSETTDLAESLYNSLMEENKKENLLQEQFCIFEANNDYGDMVTYVANQILDNSGFPITIEPTMDYNYFFEQRAALLALKISQMEKAYYDALLLALLFSKEYQEKANKQLKR